VAGRRRIASWFNPKFAHAYSGRAAAYWGKHAYDNAIADANKAISLDQNCAYMIRGLARSDKGEAGGSGARSSVIRPPMRSCPEGVDGTAIALLCESAALDEHRDVYTAAKKEGCDGADQGQNHGRSVLPAAR
jgi:hypothetical protein